MTEKRYMMGNEAIAHGGIESGVGVVAGYPGTPVTEIVESYVEYPWVHVEWSANEKVALEIAMGASLCNVRAMAAMKHNGTNVVTDFLMHLNFTGVVGGLVLVSADDPGGLSSQNEEDTRILLREYANLPVFDPSNVVEAKEMIKEAYGLSEKTQLCYVLRPVMRICHMRSMVECQDPIKPRHAEFKDDRARFVMSAVEVKEFDGIKRPQVRHRWLNSKQKELQELMEESRFNSVEPGEGKIGLIGCGIGYSYLREAARYADKCYPILKLCTLPLPEKKVVSFAEGLDTIVVFEETEPYVEGKVKEILYRSKADTKVLGRSSFLRGDGELSTEMVLDAVKTLDPKTRVRTVESPNLGITVPVRTRTQCVGCSYRGLLHALKVISRKYGGIVTGDIGCYDAGSFPPMSLQSTIYCMGSSIPMAMGMSFAGIDRPVFSIIGDSTFYHNGIIGLLNAVHQNAKVVIVLCDNGTTAMTGFQPHPGSREDIRGRNAPAVDVEKLARSLNIPTRIVNPLEVKEVKKELEAAVKDNGVSLVISRSPCYLLSSRRGVKLFEPRTVNVLTERCTGCRLCINDFGCPAITISNKKASVNQSICVGCGLCLEVCPQEAIQ